MVAGFLKRDQRPRELRQNVGDSDGLRISEGIEVGGERRGLVQAQVSRSDPASVWKVLFGRRTCCGEKSELKSGTARVGSVTGFKPNKERSASEGG